MSAARRGIPLRRRILAEHRRVAYPLAIALVVNVLAYAFIVYPLSQSVANIEERDRTAEAALAAARADYAQASGTLTGKDRAARELDTFYTRVLPANVASARRLTSLRLHQLARQANLDSESTTLAEVEDRESTLKALRVVMKLTGSYSAMRAFIYQLEASPEFVVIDNVKLSEEAVDEGQLQVEVQLSTYFRSSER